MTSERPKSEKVLLYSHKYNAENIGVLNVCSSLNWMSASRLKLNPTKTEVLWLGSCQQLSQISISVIPLQSRTIRVVESARDLGVVIDSQVVAVRAALW